MKYNNELKTIDTPEKAYLLGFMYGDGTITTYVEKTGRIRHLTKISIHEHDEELINDLYNKFSFFNKNSFDYSKYNKKSGIQKALVKSSKNLFNDFILNGVYPRKSYENKFDMRLPELDKSLISHFIRGFFDADGSVYTPTNRKNLISIELCSVSKLFINDINNYLINLKIIPWKIREKPPKGKSKQILYILTYNKTSEILKLIDLIYKDNTISMRRKREICLNYKPVDKVLDRNLSCPNCSSNYITKNGKRGNSVRYICENCKKGFSVKIC